jgi:hypothetical protein
MVRRLVNCTDPFALRTECKSDPLTLRNFLKDNRHVLSPTTLRHRISDNCFNCVGESATSLDCYFRIKKGWRNISSGHRYSLIRS